MTAQLERADGWVVCRKFQQIPVPNIDLLPLWAERNRVRPDDYLVNSRLELCFQAKELPDLNAIFDKSPLHRLVKLLGSVVPWSNAGLARFERQMKVHK